VPAAPALGKETVMFRDDSGQATAEYALVIVAAAVIALALIIWASTSGVLPDFFNAVVAKVKGMVTGTPTP
jgi:Flp pilus assembly pilin Flp